MAPFFRYRGDRCDRYAIATYNIEARYSETKEALAHKLDKDACRYIIDETKIMQTWIKQHLSDAMKQ